MGIVEDKVIPLTFKKTKKDFVGREEGERRERRGGDRKERGERGERGEKGERGDRGYGRGKRRENREGEEKTEGKDEIVEVNYETKDEWSILLIYF